MDYTRIYADFIRDRLLKQPEKPDYFETHHIKPRCLGGGDEPDNLVRLTPEDHLFAHILLAVIHGGQLWSACFLMTSRIKGERLRSSRGLRASFGMARRKWAEYASTRSGLSGSDNGNYNPTIHSWVNLDSGEHRLATLHEMWLEFGGNRGMWTSVSSKNGEKQSALGWAINDGKPRLRSSKGKIFNFVNRDGRVFSGTQKEFSIAFGVSVASCTRVVRQASVTTCGWRLDGVADRSAYANKITGRSSNYRRGKKYMAKKDGVTICGLIHELAEKLETTPKRIHAVLPMIRQGKLRAYKGWDLRLLE